MNVAEDEDGYRRSTAGIRRVFSLILGILAVLWLMVVPAIDVWQRYGQAKLEASIRLSLVADRVSSWMAANLDIWPYETVRLPGVVVSALRGASLPPSRLTLVTDDGQRTEFLSTGRSGLFVVNLSDTVSDGRRSVGRIEMTVVLDDALAPATWSALVGMISVAMMLFLARLVGRKALDRSLAEIAASRARLALRVEELEAARRQLAHQTASLQMANQDIAHVALLATHHLREPLRTVMSYAQLLVRWHHRGDRDPAQAAGYVGFIKGGVTRMQKQLEALSVYLGMRERALNLAPTSLADQLSEAMARMGPRLTEAMARMVVTPLPMVQGHPERLVELFCDLIAHALRSVRPAVTPVIRVSAVAGHQTWIVRFSDNGITLAERDPERMFHLLVHDQDGAMDTGLASVRLIAFLLGGSVWAEANDDGATICVELPEARGAVPAPLPAT